MNITGKTLLFKSCIELYLLLHPRMGRKTKFQSSWLEKSDVNGDQLSKYIVPKKGDDFHCKCRFCDCEINTGNAGVYAIYQHASGKLHKEKALLFHGRTTQTTIQFQRVGEVNMHALILCSKSNQSNGPGRAMLRLLIFLVKRWFASRIAVNPGKSTVGSLLVRCNLVFLQGYSSG